MMAFVLLIHRLQQIARRYGGREPQEAQVSHMLAMLLALKAEREVLFAKPLEWSLLENIGCLQPFKG